MRLLALMALTVALTVACGVEPVAQCEYCHAERRAARVCVTDVYGEGPEEIVLVIYIHREMRSCEVPGFDTGLDSDTCESDDAEAIAVAPAPDYRVVCE